MSGWLQGVGYLVFVLACGCSFPVVVALSRRRSRRAAKEARATPITAEMWTQWTAPDGTVHIPIGYWLVDETFDLSAPMVYGEGIGRTVLGHAPRKARPPKKTSPRVVSKEPIPPPPGARCAWLPRTLGLSR